jgi:peptidoglycan-N-acetylglucosamine deacetylase
MLTYRTFNYISLFVLAAILALWISLNWFDLYLCLALVLIYGGVLFLGSYFIQLGFFIPTQNKGSGKEAFISLTFDDGPHPEYTPAVLDLLAEYQVKATFFCIGKEIEKYPELVARIAREGHLIGNHSYSHSNFFDFYSWRRVKRELEQTNELISRYTGQQAQWFRPPFGVTNPPISRAVKALGLKVIGWSVRSLDTVIHDEKRLSRKVMQKLSAGDVILFHDTHAHVVPVLRTILEELKKRGLEVRPLDEVLNQKAYA